MYEREKTTKTDEDKRISLTDAENNKVKCQRQEVTDCKVMATVVLRMCGGGIKRITNA